MNKLHGKHMQGMQIVCSFHNIKLVCKVYTLCAWLVYIHNLETCFANWVHFIMVSKCDQ